MKKKDGGFEKLFRKSLERLPGYSMRLYDNGRTPTDRTVLADFMHFDPEGAYAFECKSSASNRIQFRDFGEKGSGIHAEQLRELADFAIQGRCNASYLALNYRNSGTLVLVGVGTALCFLETKKSISESDARKIGMVQQPHPDGGWALCL